MEHFYKNIDGWFTYPDFYSGLIKNASDGYKIAEVGVWKGKSTSYIGVEIINSGKDIKFYAIDSFEGSPEHKSPESLYYEPLLEIEDGLYNHFKENIKSVEQVVTHIKKYSLDASKDFEDGFFDVVYIDACHDYECVIEDIKAWYPKVKVGGILAGHDLGHPPIMKALNEFFGEGGWEEIEPESVWLHKK